MHPPERALRVGILGAGWVAGARHFPVYQKRKETEVVAICDQRRQRAETFAKARGIGFATDSLTDFFAQGLDLVSICTPPFAHRDEAIAALAAGCNVFMEKPMAMTSEDAQAIARAADESGKLLCISHNFLFSRSMLRLRQILDSGEAGKIQFVIGLQASSPRRRLPSWYGTLPGGLFFDESPHLLYLIAGLLGDLQLVSATATANAPGAEQPVRAVHAVLTSAVAPATVTMTFETPVSEWHLIVVCEHRILMADLFRDISAVLGSDGEHHAKDILKTSLSLGAQHLGGFVKSGTQLASRKQSWGHETLISKVIDAVLHKTPSPVPLEDSLRVVSVTDAILHAIN
ncbi:MAG: Gfo/Idh/MocA family protein [Thermomicrobiales bacterium]